MSDTYEVVLKRLKEQANKKPLILKVDSDRYLTSGEIAMAKLVFKDSIDYSKVRVINGKFYGVPSLTGNAMTPFGHIHLPSNDYAAVSDFSKSTGERRHWFIHEMTHIWQSQLGFKNFSVGMCHIFTGGYSSSNKVTTPDTPKDGDLRSYATDIRGTDTNKKFNEFNFEQQGRIIEFWYDACYLQKEEPKRPHHQRSLKLLGYIERILRDFLHNPSNKNLLPKSTL